MPRDYIHFDHVPRLSDSSPTPDWFLTASDNEGTSYKNAGGDGAYTCAGGPSSHAYREVGGKVPDTAKQLILRFDPGRIPGEGLRKPSGTWIRA